MTQTEFQTAADYADALTTCRRSKNILGGITLVLLATQVAVFFIARFKIDFSQPGHATDLAKYVTGGIDFLGVAIPIVMAIALLLIVAIMLVGRLIGVSHLVSAFLWCVLLAAILFPWQAFLSNQTFTSPEFKVPGVLYNWAELLAKVRQAPQGLNAAILYWGRFVGAPVAAMVVLAVIGYQSRRGLRLAFGEVAPSTPPIDHPVG